MGKVEELRVQVRLGPVMIKRQMHLANLEKLETETNEKIDVSILTKKIC